MQVALSSDHKYRFKCIKHINHLLPTQSDRTRWTIKNEQKLQFKISTDQMFLGHVGDMLRLMGFPALGQAASVDHPADWYSNPTTILLLLLDSQACRWVTGIKVYSI